MGRDGVCELLARKRPLPGSGPLAFRRYEYTQFSIVQAPADFPDGEYTVTAEDGQELPVTRAQGLWIIHNADEGYEARPQECA